MSAKPHTLSFPLDAGQVANIDDMLDTLFRGSQSGGSSDESGFPVDLAGGADVVIGILPVTNGGTGFASTTQGDIFYADAADSIAKLAKNTSATRYLSNTGGSNNPAWAQVAMATGVSGVLPEANGGTNQSTYSQGDLLYASAANTLSKLAKDTTATRYLSNTGGSNNPAWAQVALTTGVTGTLPVANGGTGNTTFTAYGVICGGTTATNPFQSVASVGIAQQVLASNGAGAVPSFQSLTALSGGFDTQRKRLWVQAQSGTTSLDTFSGPWSAPTGVITDATSNVRGYINYATANTAGTSARAITNATITRVEHQPTITFIMRTGADISSIRIFAGLYATSTFPDADTLVQKGVLFRYSTAAGDGGWVGVAYDGTTQSTSATIAAITTSAEYVLKMRCASSSSVFLSVNGGTEVQITTNIPTSTNMRVTIGIVTQANSVRTYDLSLIYVEAN